VFTRTRGYVAAASSSYCRLQHGDFAPSVPTDSGGVPLPAGRGRSERGDANRVLRLRGLVVVLDSDNLDRRIDIRE
jgi:hypothetical protein